MDISFDSLPFEIQVQIFSYLSVDELHRLVAPVCKIWTRLASMSRREITLNGKIQSVKNMNNNVRRSFKIRNIRFVNIWTWYVLSRSLPAFNYLRRFEFSSCNLDATCIKRLVTRFPLIEGVKLDFISGEFEILIVRAIAEWRFLKDVSIDAKSVRPTGGTKIVELYAVKCEYLRQLELFNFRIFGRGIAKLTKLRGSTLEVLNIGDFSSTKFTLAPNYMTRCLARCPNLKVLYLIPQHGAVRLKNNELLEELHVTAYGYFQALLKKVILHHLTTLVTYFTSFNARILIKHCPILKRLDVSFHDIRNEDVAFIARYCRKLERFTMAFNSVGTLESLSTITLNSTNLSYLEFSRCKQIKKTKANLAILAEARRSKPSLEIVIK